MYFPYGSKETEWLKNQDPLLGAAMDRIGPIERPIMPDLFASILHSIIGQQISTRAHATVWNHLTSRIRPLDATTVCTHTPEEIQSFGMTHRKAAYILSFARSVRDGTLDLDGIRQLPDLEVVRRLTTIQGIGIWTAEMILIFCLQRPNVVSWGDLGIQRGMRMLYGLEMIDRVIFSQITERYAPYGTVAGLYLWAISSGSLPELSDPAKQASKDMKAGLTPSRPKPRAFKNRLDATVIEEDATPPHPATEVHRILPTDNEMWKATTANDASYDGVFLYAVRSTGIFCRPSCQSKTPKRENVVFFETAEQAREAGFRPCKRCRSDLAVFEPDRALALCARTVLDTLFQDRAARELALRNLGISRKRLGTVFKTTYGITLTTHLNNLRVAHAQLLLTDPKRTLVDIGLSSGFDSMSGFYACFRAKTGMTPATFRKGG